MAEISGGNKIKEGIKSSEEQPQAKTDCGKVRSKEHEEALDKKIAEIRKKNQLIEKRKEVLSEKIEKFMSE
ncbi:unnamed protein product [Gongylonema pulchrum]|uniref:Transposase n=1 Tax=Gongylonema pulchrum TaxID=637853 RepID=A0A183DEL4_9BILA|nr:unnamed protein product [Gongylonema pulchrum]